MTCGVRNSDRHEDYRALKEEMVRLFKKADLSEAIRALDRRFHESTYSLRSIFFDDQRKILNVILQSTLGEAEAVYRQMYETYASIMRFVSDLRIPLPRAFSISAEFALNSSLRAAFEDIDNLDLSRIRNLIEDAQAQGVSLDGATLGFSLRKTIKRLSEKLLQDPDNLSLMKTLEAAAGLARSLPFEVNVWRAQNHFYQMLQKIYPERLLSAQDDAAAREWIDHFVALGRNLSVHVDAPSIPELQAA
jgi:hypothetical protein